MLKEGKAEPHFFAPQAGWVTFRVRSEKDLETAKELILLAHENAKKQAAFHATRPAPQNKTSHQANTALTPSSHLSSTAD